MTHTDRFRKIFWRSLFGILLLLGSWVMVLRVTQGLAGVTNLSDRFPWGLWIGFDVMCGVGLAAGGFAITTAVYVFQVERWRPVVRPAILTAFLGYVLVIVALLADLGRPWNLWRPLVFWNPRSVMFEVAWCVTLYTTVLFLEFSGMVFERLKWVKALSLQKSVTVPLVMLGALLSTLHQSSLGSLYLIVPGKLHPLWYSSMLPILFWISAIMVGLAMVIVESHLSARVFKRHLELPLLSEIGHFLVGALLVYAVARIYDLGHRHVLGRIFEPTWESSLFLLEFAGGVLLPLGLLALRKVRFSGTGLYVSALLVVLGFITNRLNVAITGFETAQGVKYLPAWSEMVVTFMFVAIGFAAFGLAVRHLAVFPPERDAAQGGAA